MVKYIYIEQVIISAKLYIKLIEMENSKSTVIINDIYIRLKFQTRKHILKENWYLALAK